MTTDADALRPTDTWLPLDVDEADYVVVDYVDLLATGESVASVVVTCEAIEGTDASASSRPSGAAEINGTQARQLITGAVDGVVYLVRFRATLTPAPRVLVIPGLLPALRVGAT